MGGATRQSGAATHPLTTAAPRRELRRHRAQMSRPGADRAGWPPTQYERRIKCVKNGGLGLGEVVRVVYGHRDNPKVVEAIVSFVAWLSAGDAIETDRSCPSGAFIVAALPPRTQPDTAHAS
jgi:hypothetical protein